MKNEWVNATVVPQRDGRYEVRGIFPGELENEATTMSAEWHDGQWWLETSTGPYNGDLSSDFSWREMWVSRAC